MSNHTPFTLSVTAAELNSSPAAQILQLLQNCLQAFAEIPPSTRKKLSAEMRKTVESIKADYQKINLIINTSTLELFTVDETTNSINSTIIQLIEQNLRSFSKLTTLPYSCADFFDLFAKVQNFFLGKSSAGENFSNNLKNLDPLLFVTRLSKLDISKTLSAESLSEDTELGITLANPAK